MDVVLLYLATAIFLLAVIVLMVAGGVAIDFSFLAFFSLIVVIALKGGKYEVRDERMLLLLSVFVALSFLYIITAEVKVHWLLHATLFLVAATALYSAMRRDYDTGGHQERNLSRVMLWFGCVVVSCICTLYSEEEYDLLGYAERLCGI